jgi:hypothetical protein
LWTNSIAFVAARRRPEPKTIGKHDVRRTFEFDICSRRHIAPSHSVRSLALAVETLAVKLRVDRISAEDADRLLITLVVRAPAQRTGPMACRKRKGLIVEEQRRPAPGNPLGRDPPFELECARDPAFGGPCANDFATSMNATTVAKPITAK